MNVLNTYHPTTALQLVPTSCARILVLDAQIPYSCFCIRTAITPDTNTNGECVNRGEKDRLLWEKISQADRPTVDLVAGAQQAVMKIKYHNAKQESYDLVILGDELPMAESIEAAKFIRKLNYRGAIVALAKAGTNISLLMESGVNEVLAASPSEAVIQELLDKYIYDGQFAKMREHTATRGAVKCKSDKHLIESFIAESQEEIGRLTQLLLSLGQENPSWSDLQVYRSSFRVLSIGLYNLHLHRLMQDSNQLESSLITGDYDLLKQKLSHFIHTLHQLQRKLRKSREKNPYNVVTYANPKDKIKDVKSMVSKLDQAIAYLAVYNIDALDQIIHEISEQPFFLDITNHIMQIQRDVLHGEYDKAHEWLRETRQDILFC